MTDYAYLGAEELAPQIKSGDVSPVEITQFYLDRIAAHDDTIKAFITVTGEHALEKARQAEAEIKSGNYRGPLHGMPIAIKDTYKTEGIRSTSGSALFKENVPDETSTPVKNLLEGSGAVMVGKLNMHDLGPGSAGFNPTFGHTRNPWNTDHIVGGSSGGSGAALAAGMAPVVTGTDMWGSLRIPAAMCGVYGFKPTVGLISSANNIPTSETLDMTGPMARTAKDLAFVLQSMASFDPKDPTSVEVDVPDIVAEIDAGISGTRIGVPSYYRKGLSTDVERMFEESIEKVRSLGAEVVDIDIPELEVAKFAGLATALPESGANYLNSLREEPSKHAQDVRALLMAGSILSGAQYVTAQKARRLLTQAFARAFGEVDLLLAPTYPQNTPSFEEDWAMQALDVVEQALPTTVPANLTGAPALSVPMGLDPQGVPTGMQFFGPYWSEKKLLQAARAWETTNPIDYAAVPLGR